MFHYTIRNHDAQGCELLLYPGSFELEMGQDLSSGQLNRKVSRVKVMLASGVVVAMSLGQFSYALAAAEGGESFGAAVFANTDTPGMRNFLKASPETFDAVYPAYFTLGKDGTLNYGTISQAFSGEMAQNGTKILPVITFEGETVPFSTELAEELLHLYRLYRFDGFTLDFPQTAGPQVLEFVNQLNEHLVGLPLNIVLYPARHSYDYKAVAAAATTVLVNPLDRRAQQTVSPYYSVKQTAQVLDKVIQGGIGEDQIVLALDLGGRIWGAGWDGSIPVDPKTVGEITQNYALRERYDQKNGSVYLDFTVKAGQKLEINGQRVYPGNYTINIGASTYAREVLMLASKRDVKGVTLLHMPLAPTDIWNYFHVWLGGAYFEDVSGTFGRDEIMKAYVDGIMQGVGPSRFAPYNPITRGEAAAIISRMLQLPEAPKRPPFSDISGHWAEKYIASAYFSGHMIGDVDGTFKPDDILTREQAAVLSARISGLEHKQQRTGVFSDVPPESWSYESIMALHKAGILKGYGDGTFKPKQNMTREEIAILINRLEKVMP